MDRIYKCRGKTLDALIRRRNSGIFAVWGHDLTRSLGYVIVGSFITLAFICVVAAYKYGIVIRRYSFMEYGKQYEIKDYYKPFHSLNNYRSLSTFNSNAIDSKIFFTKQSTWAYFDNIRIILQAQSIPDNAAVLLLGGGGCSLAKTIIQQYPSSHIDVIEISKTMVSITKRFFLSPRETQKITLLLRDASEYVTHTKKQYDIIIVDLFVNSEIPKNSLGWRFIHTLARLSKMRTIVFVNLLGAKKSSVQQIISYYKRAFPNHHLYLNGKTTSTLIAVHQLKGNFPHQALIPV
ncbi:MAG: hypothetical protein AAB557_02200 [Patescibacteria group bacterium]